ncbi:MAG: hypothetical protein JRJ84_21375, partial [Deltaproteobacteria bacterium]|nr:hypothetical protein [Deltaproteobacteria bacterium]
MRFRPVDVRAAVVTFLAAVLVLLGPAVAHAWPTTWEPAPQCGPVPLSDGDDVQPNSIDVIGSPPALYAYDDASVPYADQKVYFRIQLVDDPSGQGGQGAFKAYAWYLLIEANESYSEWDFRYYLGGITERLVFEQNTASTTDWCTDEADVPELAAYDILLDARVTQDPGTGYFLLDLQMPRADWDTFTNFYDPADIFITAGTSTSESVVNKDTVGDCANWEENFNPDTDLDTVGDCEDLCQGYDDLDDYDGDGIPDGCDIPTVTVDFLTTTDTQPTLTGTLDLPPGPNPTDFCVTVD